MIGIFRKKVEDAVREFNEDNLPTSVLPDTPTGESEVLGHDANLALVIRELAPVQLDDLRKERDRLTKRLPGFPRPDRRGFFLPKMIKQHGSGDKTL